MSEFVAIVGSRAHPDLEMVRAYVRALPKGTVVVTGGARGVDAAAREAAAEWMEYVPVHDDGAIKVRTSWGATTYLKAWHYLSAGARDLLLARNTMIVVQAHRVVAFPDGSKGGAFDALEQARRFRRPAELRWVDGRVEPFRGRRVRV